MPFPPTPSNTPSNTPTPSITASVTPTQTPTGTVCPGLTPTNTPTISLTPSITSSPSNTPSMTATNTQTPTQTQTPTSTVGTSPTPTNTLTASPTQTATQTPTKTNPECTCFSSATVNVTVAGNITFNDCDGNPTIENFNPGNGQTYGDGTFCIRKDTNGGTAEYTIVSYNNCCTPPPPPTSTPTQTPTSTLAGSKSLELRVLDIASTPQTITMFYNVNGGGNINIPGGTSVIFPITCTLLYTIPGLTSSDIVIFGTSINCAMEGAGGTTCPGFVGSLTTYSYVVDAPTVQTLSLTIDTQDIP